MVVCTVRFLYHSAYHYSTFLEALRVRSTLNALTHKWISGLRAFLLNITTACSSKNGQGSAAGEAPAEEISSLGTGACGREAGASLDGGRGVGAAPAAVDVS